jgi:hypothetical protein
MDARKTLRSLFQAFQRCESGNVAIIAAAVMPVIVGFCGLGADVGYWYYRQRALQSAVDIAAYNAAIMLRSGAREAAIAEGASSDATENGWVSSQGTITVHTPPTSGASQNPESVEVILTERQPRFFSQVFSSDVVNVSVRSVGHYNNAGSACILTLNKTESHALEFWGSNTTTLNNCNAMSNSFADDGLAVGGSSSLTVPCAISVGGVAISSTFNETQCTTPKIHAGPARDPYDSLPAPAIPGACTNPPGGAAPLQPGLYCGGLSINSTKTLNPGVYVISGGTFKLNANADITGSGVIFYLTNGATIQFNGNATMDLSAPTSGTYQGVLFFSDRTQTNATQSFNGTAQSKLTGALYFPTQHVEKNGNFSGANGCMKIVADTVTLSGNSNIQATCPGTGLGDIPIPGAIALVE